MVETAVLETETTRKGLRLLLSISLLAIKNWMVWRSGNVV